MSADTFYSNIQKYLFQYTDLVEHSNSLGLSNKAVNAENLFCLICNKAFDWDLVNANENNVTQDTLDLHDIKKRISVQVTSDKNFKRKKENSIAGFNAKGHGEKYETFIILFVSKSVPSAILKTIKLDRTLCETFGIQKLLNKIYYTCKSAIILKELAEILSIELRPVPIAYPESKYEIPAGKQKQIPTQSLHQEPYGLLIKRMALIDDLFLFSQQGNGLLVGGHGVGKSRSLHELQAEYQKKNIPCFIFRINDFLTGDEHELKDQLNIDTDWLEGIQNIVFEQDSAKGLIVFDAFDTSKDETVKSKVLQHIKKALSYLAPNWNVLVSARLFDATRSPRLMDLFPVNKGKDVIFCRHFEIPKLSPLELEDAVKTDRSLLNTVERSSTALKEILRVPYFLKLLEQITDEEYDQGAPEIYKIETEEGLLHAFWNRKVSAYPIYDVFLNKLTTILVSSERLSSNKNKILAATSDLDCMDSLISLGILSESLASKQNISFSHNILLDFVLSHYLIPEGPKEVVEYIGQNPRLPFIFSQGFIYFYSRVWKHDTNLFWDHYFTFQGAGSPLFRLFHQVIINNVLCLSYNSINEIAPLFSYPQQKRRGEMIRKLLESIRFLNKETVDKKYIDILYAASSSLNVSFIWQLGFLLNNYIRSQTDKPVESLEQTAIACLNYFVFFLEQRKNSDDKYFVETNGGYWSLENLCQMYHVLGTRAKQVLTDALKMLDEENSPIGFFQILSDKIPLIFKNDPEFIIKVYIKLYFHDEKSDQETRLGNSPIMALRSNRRQDYNLVRHKLEEIYPRLITSSPDVAVQAGLNIVNQLISKEIYRRPDSYAVSVIGIESKILPDHYFHVHEMDKEEGFLTHPEHIFKLAEKYLLNDEKELYEHLIGLIVKYSEVAYLWKKLLILASSYPFQLKELGVSLLSNRILLLCNETVYESGELIKKLWPSLSLTEKAELENTIIGLSPSKMWNEEKIGERINMLLNCIPSDGLQLKESSDLIKGHEKIMNIPVVQSSGLMPYYPSRDKSMRRAGADPSDHFEVMIYELIEKIETVNSKYDVNHAPRFVISEFEERLPEIKALLQFSKTGYKNTEMNHSADYAVTNFAKLLLRSPAGIEAALKELQVEIALYYIFLERCKAKKYEAGDISKRNVAYSQTPRIAASQIFSTLVGSGNHEAFGPILLGLMNDNMIMVRHYALASLQCFWHFDRAAFWGKVEERLTLENDEKCLQTLICSICYDNVIEFDTDKVEKLALDLSLRLKGSGATPEIWRDLLVLSLKLIMKCSSAAGYKIIAENTDNKTFCRHLILEIIALIDPHRKTNDYSKDPKQNTVMLGILKSIIKDKFDAVQGNGLGGDEANKGLEIIDLFIQHIYFTIKDGKKHKDTELTEGKKLAFFEVIKPTLRYIIDRSMEIENGFMLAHTGYYFILLLNILVDHDGKFVFAILSDIIKCSSATNFTYDQTITAETVKLIGKIMIDHKEILSDPLNFDNLIIILDQFENSGWPEALELALRIKDVF